MIRPFGVFLINKPAGISSFKVVAILRRIIGIKKIGHSGTLDPFATGLLQLCYGRATKILTHLNTKDKTYKAKVVFGKQTDTADIEGKVILEEPFDMENIKAKLDAAVLAMQKVKSQIPPKYSAIKIDGVRAYKLARNDENFEIPSRPINIYHFEVLEIGENFIVYEAKVSKGTYIRVLSETFANLLGTIGFTAELERVKIGDSSIENSVKLDDLTPENLENYVHPIEEFLTDFPQFILEENIDMYKNGMRLKVAANDAEQVFVLDNNKIGIGFGKIENGILSPKTVLI